MGEPASVGELGSSGRMLGEGIVSPKSIGATVGVDTVGDGVISGRATDVEDTTVAEISCGTDDGKLRLAGSSGQLGKSGKLGSVGLTVCLGQLDELLDAKLAQAFSPFLALLEESGLECSPVGKSGKVVRPVLIKSDSISPGTNSM